MALMSLDYKEAETDFKIAGNCSSDFQVGCLLLQFYLTDDIASIHYYEKKYVGSDILLSLQMME